MPGVPRELAEHSLHVRPDAKPGKQPLRRFVEDRRRAIGEEITRLLAAGSGINYLIDAGQSERIFRASLVQAGVVYTHAPGFVLLQNEDWVGQPLRVQDFHDEAGCK